jgi:gas vesicle protein
MLTYLITGAAAGIIGILSGQAGLLLARQAGDKRFEQLERDVITRLHAIHQEGFNQTEITRKEISAMASDLASKMVTREEAAEAFKQVAEAQLRMAQAAQTRPMSSMVPAQAEAPVNEQLAALDRRFAQMASQLGLS